MSDDKSRTGVADRRRISLDQQYEVRDWAHWFGVTEARLRQVVHKVGPMVDDVEREVSRS